MKLVECVPNFSEGQRKEICEKIASAIKSVNGVSFLDLQMDKDHNRSVLTFVGSIENVGKAAFEGAKKASELIDLNKHKGEHPRIGAVDVIPFVPLGDTTMSECIVISKEVGEMIGEELGIPVYLYEESATRPERRNLANIRKGEFEALKKELGKNPERLPDFGPNKVHPTAGAVAVGARMPLIAYNIDLETKELKIAKNIAKRIRESSGGLPSVKALGMWVEERGMAQVSMNLCNYTVTSMYKVYKAVEEETQKCSVEIHSSEVVGLLPRAAIRDEWVKELKISNFQKSQIIENRI